MKIKAVLFDIDGTLVDSNDLHAAAWDEAFRAAGITLALGDIRAQIGKGTDMLVPALVPDASDDLTEDLGKAHGAIFKARYLETVHPFPRARDLLIETDRAGKRVVLASSASQAELEYYVTLLDVEKIVAAGTTADDVENTKPAPDIFAVALKKVAPLRADEVIAVGDTPFDVHSAGQCGIASVALRSGGFPDAQLREAGALAIYDDASDLLAQFARSALAG